VLLLDSVSRIPATWLTRALRQRDVNRRSFAEHALGPDLTTVTFDDFTTKVQSNAEPGKLPIVDVGRPEEVVSLSRSEGSPGIALVCCNK
jgi:hypothetical protein